MFIRNYFSICCLLIVLLFSGTVGAALITMEIETVCTVSNFDAYDSGSELRIDYLVSNTTLSNNSDDAIYRILIPAGINQSIYSVHVPDNWVALARSDNIELYTLSTSKAIQCGEAKTFSFFAQSLTTQSAEIQAMTTIGYWAIPVSAEIPAVPEPSAILLLASGAWFLKRKA